MAKTKTNNSPVSSLVSVPEILATKEQRALKENGQIRTSDTPFSPPGIGVKHSAITFRERNDGWYAAFNERGERLFYSVGPKVVRDMFIYVAEAN